MGTVTCQECVHVTQDGQEQIVQCVLREVRASMVIAKIGRLNAFASADTKELLATFQDVKLDATKPGVFASILSYVTADPDGREKIARIALRNMDA